MIELHTVLIETSSYRLGWYDAERTIIVGDIVQGWGWDDVRTLCMCIADEARKLDYDFVTVWYFRGMTVMWPRGTDTIVNLRQVLKIDPPNERLVYFVGQTNLLQQLMNLLSKSYGLSHIAVKYRFVASFEAVLRELEAEKIT
jgi:hypothetical protein